MHSNSITRWPLVALAALTLLLGGAIACGGDDDDDATNTPTSTGDASADPSSDASPGATRTPAGTPIETAAGNPGDSFICEEADRARGVGAFVSLDKEEAKYGVGEPVDITLTVANCATSDVTLYFASAQRYDISVETSDGGLVVWRSSQDKAFAEVLGEETLSPGQTIVYEETWDQKNSDGEQVDPGKYNMSAFSIGCTEEGRSNCRFGPVIEFDIE